MFSLLAEEVVEDRKIMRIRPTFVFLRKNNRLLKKSDVSIIDTPLFLCYTFKRGMLMSFYEIETEQENYFLVGERGLLETPAHFHSAMEMHFVEEGSLDVILDGEKRTLHAGDACFCDSFTIHAIPAPTQVKSYHLVGLKSAFDQAFSLFGDNMPPKFFRFKNFPLLHSLLEICNENKKNNVIGYAIFTGVLHIMLGEISKSTPFIPHTVGRKNTLVCDILRYAEENPANDLSLAALSNKFNYSREHLSRILHQCLSSTWNAHVNRLRVKKASVILSKKPDATVLEVAYACGFESPNTFYRAYKKEFGKPPRK